MGVEESNERWRTLPSVRALVEDPALADALAQYPHDVLVQTARSVIARARRLLADGRPGSVTAADVLKELDAIRRLRLRRVINATGVVLHTNLGRAPLPEAALRAIEQAADYTNLEFQLSTGTRGGRDEGVAGHLRALTGAEDAFAVNNCAAATLLVLTAVATGREVIVSRGELVEIGGGFRVPEVLQQSGCKLIEVGTTNRTRESDYERAFTPNTAAVLRVHRSNFALVGFTEDVPVATLSSLAHRRNVPLLFDQGTGELPVVASAIREGCDVVTFSGDKLLGGPQAGLIAGRAAVIDQARHHPLARALRLDKLSLAGLEATLALWRTGQVTSIPVQRMLAEPLEIIRTRAEKLGGCLGSLIDWRLVSTTGAAGGGTRPGEQIPSFAIAVRVEHPLPLMRQLREGEVPVVGRMSDNEILFDMRTVSDDDVALVGRLLTEAARRCLQAEADEEEGDREAAGPSPVLKSRQEAQRGPS